MRTATVAACDRIDDRKSKPSPAAAARFVVPAEALEGMREKLRLEPCPFVRHVQLDRPVTIARGELDRAGPIAQRVVDKVRERLTEASRVAR